MAVCIQVDVDQQRETAQRLDIKAMPSVIALRGHAEIDRVVGLQRPAQFIMWLDGLLAGRKAVDELREQAAAKPNEPKLRLKLAEHLLDTGHLEEARVEFVWLWQHMLEFEPAMIGVKHSFFVNTLRRLVEAFPPARSTFEEFRERTAPPRSGTPNHDSLLDWFSLNDILGNDQANVRWFDESWSTATPTKELRALVERRIAPFLIAADRWADVGAFMATRFRACRGLLSFGSTRPRRTPMTHSEWRSPFESMLTRTSEESPGRWFVVSARQGATRKLLAWMLPRASSMDRRRWPRLSTVRKCLPN
jgi:hypothetical protein